MIYVLAADLGWPPSELERCSLAELWTAWGAYAKRQGWITGPDTSEAAIAELDDLMARYPD